MMRGNCYLDKELVKLRLHHDRSHINKQVSEKFPSKEVNRESQI